MSEENTGAEASAPEQSAEQVIDSIDSGHEEVVESDEVSESDEAIEASDATDGELSEVLESDDATAEEKVEAAVELKKRMVFQVNGKEVEKEIDLSDEDGLHELLQKGFAADERFQKASSIEKQMKEFAQVLQSDPIQALIAAGHDPDKVAEMYMQQRIEEMQKSPEQLQLEQLQKQVEDERTLREKLEQENASAAQSRAQEEYSRQLDDEITTALGGSDLPKSPYVVKRIAENLMIALEQGNEDISVPDILPIVERQIKGEIRQMFEAMPEEIVEKVLGTDVSTKLRKRRLKKMKKTPEGASKVQPTGQSEIKRALADKEPEAPSKAKDFFKNF